MESVVYIEKSETMAMWIVKNLTGKTYARTVATAAKQDWALKSTKYT